MCVFHLGKTQIFTRKMENNVPIYVFVVTFFLYVKHALTSLLKKNQIKAACDRHTDVIFKGNCMGTHINKFLVFLSANNSGQRLTEALLPRQPWNGSFHWKKKSSFKRKSSSCC